MDKLSKKVERVINDSIGWAKNKDKDLLLRCFAKDENLFWFTPEKEGTVRGIKNFMDTVDNFFMDERFKALKYEIKDLKINFSQNKDVAWWSCILDDENEWEGRSASWKDVRWTGILEKKENDWVIVQMHFSYGK